jgi:hypothetical protein
VTVVVAVVGVLVNVIPLRKETVDGFVMIIASGESFRSGREINEPVN